VQTTLEAIARHDGETLTAEDVQQLCGSMMMLGQYGNPEPFRIWDTPDETMEMEVHLAWVATHFAEEIAWLDELTVERIQQCLDEGLEDDERSAAVMGDLLAFIEGYDDARQLRLFA
jgi:hypothetical protein